MGEGGGDGGAAGGALGGGGEEKKGKPGNIDTFLIFVAFLVSHES